jgi:hypothetical protein
VAKAKGTVLIGLVKLLRRNRSRATELLPAPLAHYLEERVVSSAWYPEADLAGLLRVVARLLPGPEEKVLRQLGEAAARAHLQGVYADLLHTQPAARTEVLWSAQHDTGRLVITAKGPGVARHELFDFDAGSPELCETLVGYFGESYRMTGAAATEVEHTACRYKGAERCVWVCRWR